VIGATLAVAAGVGVVSGRGVRQGEAGGSAPLAAVVPVERAGEAVPAGEAGVQPGSVVNPAVESAADAAPAPAAPVASAAPERRVAQPARSAAVPAEAPAMPHASEAPVAEAEAQGGDAVAVLRRVSSVYAKVTSIQADFSQRSVNPILKTTVESRGTLYQRRPDRFLMRFAEPSGDVIVSDGAYFWVYYPSVDRKQVIKMPASRGAGAVDLQAQFVGDPVERFNAVLAGREEVGGRSADVLVLTPKQPMGYRGLKVWVDRGDGVIRRFEVTEESGLVRHFDLSNVKLNPTLADSLFRFTPPEGAHVVERG
jgi:outer membrane lipoprotein carrier protein